MKILLADDAQTIHRIVNLWLSQNGHQVTNVENGKIALEKLESEAFDALITDVNMPLVNGVELVRKALRLPDPPRLIVVLTSRCDLPQLKDTIDYANVHLFNKPFRPIELIELLESCESQKELT
jgi:two-component system chemotaxis response regulator CheY